MDDSSALSMEREEPCVKRRVLLTIGLGVWLRDTRFAADIQKDSCPKLAEESRAAIRPP